MLVILRHPLRPAFGRVPMHSLPPRAATSPRLDSLLVAAPLANDAYAPFLAATNPYLGACDPAYAAASDAYA